MRALFGLLSLGVVAVMFSDAVAKGSQGPKVISSVGSDISGFYKAL